MVPEYEKLIHTWPSIAPILAPAENDEDVEKLINLADYLIDQTRGNEQHPLMGLLDLVGTLIAEYEQRYIPEPTGTPLGCLKYFMQEHGLKQKDLVELGSPGVISEILAGKRELNKRQIKSLSARFGCSPAIFF